MEKQLPDTFIYLFQKDALKYRVACNSCGTDCGIPGMFFLLYSKQLSVVLPFTFSFL